MIRVIVVRVRVRVRVRVWVWFRVRFTFVVRPTYSLTHSWRSDAITVHLRITAAASFRFD